MVELLAVVTIVAILLSIFVPYLLHLREVADRTRCASNLGAIYKAFEAYAKDNGGVFPRVVYDETAQPVGYTSFTGPDTPSPFVAGSTVKANDVTASLWLLVRNKYLSDLGYFVCPSSGDSKDVLSNAAGQGAKLDDRSNFRKRSNLSYGYAQPFSTAARFRLDLYRPADFALMADKGPAMSKGPGLGWSSSPRELAAMNSPNHGGAGQNVLYGGGAVFFTSTPYCGMGGRDTGKGDNIYSALAPAPLEPGNSPAGNGIGVRGPQYSPAWWADSYLVPSTNDSPSE